MARSAADVLADALSLVEEERVEIASRLLASLDGPADAAVDVVWEAEIKRRLDALDAGTMKTETWDVVESRIRSRLRSGRPD